MNKIIQKQFEKFHENIKLKNFDENSKLRKKRDLLLKEIRDYLNKKYEDSDEKKPTFEHINQGSYSVGTGIKPINDDDDDYDIDVGLLFNVAKIDFKPVELKEIIKKALEKYSSREVKMKRPCVRVQYHKDGEKHYHVDLAIYSDENSNADQKTYLAKGYKGSKEKYKLWEVSDPKKLKDKINDKFEDKENQKQFKRTIRYMKRWKDLTFKSSGDARPTGIAITALALNIFTPQTYNNFTCEEDINDLKALECFVDSIINEFNISTGRLYVKLPVEPYNDLLEKMSDEQIADFKNELKYLKKKLCKAQAKIDPVEACKILNKVFGEDFEVPSKEDTAAKTIAPAIASSSEQA